MKHSKTAFGILAVAAGLLAASPAFAWHHGGPRVSFGFNFGAPYYAAPYYYPYYAAPVYYPAPVVVQSAPQPQVYTERQDMAPAQEAQNFWHYCSSARGYYPYVKECSEGWQRVPAQPAR